MTAQVDWAKTGIPLLSLASFRSLMLLVDLHHRRSQKFWNEAVYTLKSRSATSHGWYPNDAILAVPHRESCEALEKLGITAGRLSIPVWMRCIFIPESWLWDRFWWGQKSQASKSCIKRWTLNFSPGKLVRSGLHVVAEISEFSSGSMAGAVWLVLRRVVFQNATQWQLSKHFS